ncbi:hypothetical protein Cgig2_004666 [Carnegiea gigantea]|uniref:Uncharacterized protein n=1 Tax=Carnegiea gigantea TaxID=171969 RepID=A0A9Q1JZW3_9CARY|nr:hypothetical protein Cgig2_004666 [Carnegiea gigantea]
MSIEDSSYKIVIKEVGSTIQVTQKVHITSTSSMEAMDSNHEEKVMIWHQMMIELRRNDKVARTAEEEVVQETPNFEVDLENVEGNERLGDRSSGNINSNTRTNTMCFSFASQDLIAATITPQPLKNGKQQVENKECQNQEESDSLSQPPGFESPVKLDLAIHEAMEKIKEGKKTTKRSKRILEKSKRTLNRRRRVSTSSSNTSKSIQKLAKESLKIGKL